MSTGQNTFGYRLVHRWRWLDPFANLFGAVMTGLWKIPGTRSLKSMLHGTWPLAHPLHPAVTDLTIGGYTAMVAVDALYLVTGDRGLLRAADFLLVGSFITSLLSIISGLTDWNETVDEERRNGILHGLLMLLATLGFIASLVMRVNGGIDVRPAAIAISAVAWLVMIVASYFGGEMVFGFGTEVNRQAWADIGGGDWETIDVRAADLQERTPVLAATKSGVALLVTKLDGELYAIGNTCTHAGGPLNEGTFVGDKGCEIQCPWHASRFCVRDGSVHGGPATFDEPAWSVRAAASGKLEVRPKR
ncbi:MAG TPA: DUF2231 domain-containing protein [Candidatus Limnocylindria bacterium]|nr:DUF2231 domain-containing protein [Candidatus Limnocylindria bacterium]